MKKYFLLMCIALVSAIAMQSCSSDDDDDNNPLVGTKWVSENMASSIYGMFDGKRYWHVREFTSNDTYTSYYEEILTGIKGKSGYFTGEKYEYHDTYVTFFDNDGNPVNWYFISSTELCNKRSRTESGSVIYTKK